VTFSVGVVGHFTAVHHLVGDFGSAGQPHEHAYRLEVGVSGEQLRADGTLLDISVLQGVLAEAAAELDHRDLNEVPHLASPNPTAEVVARYVFEQISTALAGHGSNQLQVFIKIWESPEAYGSYTGDIG
jgi:6-pyruvoyltetrahydropterin/6-carboxytetrahydropterin synthase